MLLRLSRFIIIFFLVISLVSTPRSYAFDPLSLTAFVGYSILLHCGVVGGLYYYSKNSNHSVTASGDVINPAKVQWISTKDIQVKSKDLVAKQTFSKIKSAASSKPSTYPKLSSALKPSPAFVSSSLSVGANVMEHYSNPGVYRVVRYDKTSYNTWGPDSLAPQDGSYNVKISLDYYGSGRHCLQVGSDWKNIPGDTGFGTCTLYEVSSVTSVPDDQLVNPVLPVTPAKFASRIAANGVSGDLSDAYQAELDAMMHDADYVPTFSDATTGLPYAPPAQSEVMTPAQVDQYNKAGAAKDAAQAAATSAATAATNAKNAYIASGGDPSTGTGGDAGLYQKYLDAQAGADKAASDAAKSDSDSTDPSTYSGSFDDSTPYGDQSKDFDFGTRFKTFFDAMKNTSLFSLPNQFLGGIPSSSTSSMTIEGGRFGQFSYDFAQFNSVFLVLKSILLVLFSWLSAKIVMLKGGGS